MNSFNQITINESSVFRLCIDAMVFLIQHVYYTSATMLFFVVNEAASMQLNVIRQQVRRPDLKESRLDMLKECYFLCNKVVNEMNDTFGVVLLMATLHDFVEMVTEAMYSVANWNNCNEWYIYVLNMLVIVFSLTNLTVINFGAQHLNRQVI